MAMTLEELEKRLGRVELELVKLQEKPAQDAKTKDTIDGLARIIEELKAKIAKKKDAEDPAPPAPAPTPAPAPVPVPAPTLTKKKDKTFEQDLGLEE